MADIAKLIYKENTLYAGGSEPSNVKAFPLSGTGSSAAVLAEAQAIYDWHLAGNTPIILYGGGGLTYVPKNISSLVCYFAGVEFLSSRDGGASQTAERILSFDRSGDTVTNVVLTTSTVGDKYLSTGNNISGTFTPTLDGHPATKKYVDDIVGDINTLLSNI